MDVNLIGLLSDVHATPEPVAEALAVFRAHNVDRVICAGDVAGYGGRLEETVKLLSESGCATVMGNHDLIYRERAGSRSNDFAADYIAQLPESLDLIIEGKRLYVVHAQPPFACRGGIRLLDPQGRIREDEKNRWVSRLEFYGYDALVVGHTHQVFAAHFGRTLVVNPGSSVFNHTCAVLRFPQLKVEFFALSNKHPKKTWNWTDEIGK